MESKKKVLRNRMRQLLSSQNTEDRGARSQAIAGKLFALAPFRRARTVCFFVSTPEEVDTFPMIDRALEEGKTVAVPRCDRAAKEILFHVIRSRSGLKQGTLGILEPPQDNGTLVRPGDVDCVVVPGLAFDDSNRRLGRGEGYYDRFLPKLGPGAFKVGIGFSFQRVGKVPEAPGDIRLDHVLTD